MVTRGQRKGGMKKYCLEDSQFCKMKRGLEMDSSDGYITVAMYLILLYGILENG